MNVDKTLTCSDCNQSFTFTASEQDFYAERGFTEPRRCPTCRAARKSQRGDSGGSSYGASSGGGYGARSSGGGGGGFGASRGPREMFSATCSSCGQETQVPFRPTSGKPVYCSACFAQRRA
ncbi:MAG: zinc-ribbon domain containing protein [Chloroflexota bacterium]